jgi:hypothetical protein
MPRLFVCGQRFGLSLLIKENVCVSLSEIRLTLNVRNKAEITLNPLISRNFLDKVLLIS